MNLEAEYTERQNLVAALHDPQCYPHSVKRVRLIETHISWVLLAGRYAYKIKKPVKPGFLDFSTLAQRKHFCEEELRLNRRLAPDIYLDVVLIGGVPDSPRIGAAPAIEYAVRMRRFPAGRLLENLIARNQLEPAQIDHLAQALAAFHNHLPAAPADSNFGEAAVLGREIADNFRALEKLLPGMHPATLRKLHGKMQTLLAADRRFMAQRKRKGFVREGHGDLHLGNIVMLKDRPMPFDGIEFDPALRWIDIMDDIAFTVMDLRQHGRPDLAARLLNGWLEITGDYRGLALLPLYTANRAMVRAKVHALRAAQPGLNPRKVNALRKTAVSYLNCAEQALAPSRAALIITYGLPGSGKTTFAGKAAERYGAIRLRSDVERKRLFGLSQLADSHRALGRDALYTHAATQDTYAWLAEVAGCLLMLGYRVIVDAAFLMREERKKFRRLAQRLGVPFVIARMESDMPALRERIRQRQATGRDASEADIAVLEKLTQSQQILEPQEQALALEYKDNANFWAALEQRLAVGMKR